jgi:putative ABC transport system ATP-binding protein
MNKEQGTTLVLVTHNLELAQRTQRILRMKGGKLADDTRGQMKVEKVEREKSLGT